MSGDFFIKKHLNKGSYSSWIPPPLEEILNFAFLIWHSPWLGVLPQVDDDEMCITTCNKITWPYILSFNEK